MKKLYLVLLMCCLYNVSTAQTINIPDTTFKNYLLNQYVADINDIGFYTDVVDTNGDGEIQVSEAEAVVGLKIDIFPFETINSLQGIEYFVNLKRLTVNDTDVTSIDVSIYNQLELLDITSNQITSLDVSQNAALKTLYISNNTIASIDVTQNINLENFRSANNPLGNTDFTNNVNLIELEINNANITMLDVSQNTSLTSLNCSNNQLTTLDVSNNLSLEQLRCTDNQIPSIDVSIFPNLEYLWCSNNPINSLDVTQNPMLFSLLAQDNGLTSLDLTQNPLLGSLEVRNNQLTALDVTQNPQLFSLSCSNNQISVLDVSQQESLSFLYCYDNQLTSLDVSMQTSLIDLLCTNNQLTSLNIKNGPGNISSLNFGGNPNLAYLCADEQDIAVLQTNYLDVYGYTDCVINTYCSFDQAGETITLMGSAILDTDMDGCDVDDPLFGGLKIQIGNYNNTGIFITNANGTYSIPVLETFTTITPQLENPSYFTITPSTISVDLASATDPYTQDFCIVPNGVHNDLEVAVVPVDVARPGFDTAYKIVYRNKGNTILSGSISLLFNDDYMNLMSAAPVAATQSTGQLTWNYTNIAPQEVREIDVTMTLNTPTDASFPLNQDDIISFTATIDPIPNDETPVDNVMTLNQTVVNSFDPNDKICLQGDTITEDKVGEYVHYMIRFENTGTASAVNIVVRDDIDATYYDISTLQPLTGSHPFATRIEGQKVEFIFENINLPFDDANNDGYVLFKIKTKNTLMLNDTFANKADIYFDFNAPIITDLAETTVANPLSTADVVKDQSIVVYPIPAKDILHIQGDHGLTHAQLYDLKGTLLINMTIENNQKNISIPVHALANGMYVLKVQSEKGNHISKIVK